jgi:anti-sigma B factor antagonist
MVASSLAHASSRRRRSVTMGSTPGFQARAEVGSGVAVIALSGELDMDSTPALEQVLEQFERDGTSKVVLDLHELTFMDSTGLHSFLQAWKRASLNGHQLVLTGATPFLRRLFEITKTEFLLDDQRVGGDRGPVP